MRYTKAQIEEARESLSKWLKPGDTVYTILRHRAASGMSRVISLVILRKGQPLHPNWSAAALLGMPTKQVNGSDGIKINGCGMDMGFDLVHSLALALFNDGNALKQEWL